MSIQELFIEINPTHRLRQSTLINENKIATSLTITNY